MRRTVALRRSTRDRIVGIERTIPRLVINHHDEARLHHLANIAVAMGFEPMVQHVTWIDTKPVRIKVMSHRLRREID